MTENLNSGYGEGIKGNVNFSTGKTFFVVAQSDSANNEKIQNLFRPDADGVRRVYTTIDAALTACVTGRGDQIILSPGWTAVPSAAEILAAETKGVTIIPAGSSRYNFSFATRAAATLPQTASTPIFTATGRVRITSIIGEVTTITGATVTTGQLIAVPTVGSNVNMCATVSIASLAVGTQLSITGTLATAMAATNGAQIAQVTPITIKAGTINFSTSANNTGAIKWRVEYVPVDPGAKVIAA
jgi:hypothetical protein